MIFYYVMNKVSEADKEIMNIIPQCTLIVWGFVTVGS